MMVEPLNSCSSICSDEGNPETRGVSSRCSEFAFGLSALPLLSVTLCRLMASKTLPIDSPQMWSGALSSKVWHVNLVQSCKSCLTTDSEYQSVSPVIFPAFHNSARP